MSKREVAQGERIGVGRGIARQSTRRRLGIALTILGLISSVVFSVLCVIRGGLLFKALAIGSTLALALGLTLLRPVRLIEGEV